MQYVVGVDENGLGPRLGPLVVTAVTLRCDDDAAAKVAAGRPGRAFTRLGDSKDLVSHGDTALGEAWARAAHARAAGLAGERALESPDALFHALCIDSQETLRARCPESHGAQCWTADEERFVAEPKLTRLVERDLDRLQKRGVTVARVEVLVLCAERLNAATDAGTSRFQVDLHAMERLVLAAREAMGSEVRALCGKVGGYDRYSEAFGPLAGRLHAVVEEGRARSTYRFPGVGEIAFVRDGDAAHLAVGMASLVGKWVRDLLMDRIVRHHRSFDGDLPLASGYHDPVTARFVEATALARKARGLPDACFERRALPPPPKKATRGSLIAKR